MSVRSTPDPDPSSTAQAADPAHARPLPLAGRLLGAVMVLFLVGCGTYAILGEHWVGKARYPYREVTFDGPAAVSVGWAFIALAALPATMLMPNRKWAARWGVLAFLALMGAIVLMVKR